MDTHYVDRPPVRDLSMDLLRIFASFMVVFLHVSGSNWLAGDPATADWQIMNFYDATVRSCVPLFIMISGAFMLDPTRSVTIKKLYKSNIAKLIITYFFWILFYTFFIHIIQNGLPNSLSELRFLLKDAVMNPNYHLWYIPMMIGLYILTPLIRSFVKGANATVLFYAVALFITGTILNTLIAFRFLPFNEIYTALAVRLPLSQICWYSGYYFLGYYLYNAELTPAFRRTSYTFGILGLLACVIASGYGSYKSGAPSDLLFSSFHATTMCEAIAIFLFFKYLFGKRAFSDKAAKRIVKISSLTLGVYIIHDAILVIFKITGILSTTDFTPILSVPVISLIVYILAFGMSWLIKKIPRVSKWIV